MKTNKLMTKYFFRNMAISAAIVLGTIILITAIGVSDSGIGDVKILLNFLGELFTNPSKFVLALGVLLLLLLPIIFIAAFISVIGNNMIVFDSVVRFGGTRKSFVIAQAIQLILLTLVLTGIVLGVSKGLGNYLVNERIISMGIEEVDYTIAIPIMSFLLTFYLHGALYYRFGAKVIIIFGLFIMARSIFNTLAYHNEGIQKIMDIILQNYNLATLAYLVIVGAISVILSLKMDIR